MLLCQMNRWRRFLNWITVPADSAGETVLVTQLAWRRLRLLALGLALVTVALAISNHRLYSQAVQIRTDVHALVTNSLQITAWCGEFAGAEHARIAALQQAYEHLALAADAKRPLEDRRRSRQAHQRFQAEYLAQTDVAQNLLKRIQGKVVEVQSEL